MLPPFFHTVGKEYVVLAITASDTRASGSSFSMTRRTHHSGSQRHGERVAISPKGDSGRATVLAPRPAPPSGLPDRWGL